MCIDINISWATSNYFEVMRMDYLLNYWKSDYAEAGNFCCFPISFYFKNTILKIVSTRTLNFSKLKKKDKWTV